MLPEDEQRQLQEIKQALCRDDPTFVRLMRAIDPRVQYERTLRRALLAVVIGIGALSAGAATHRVYLAAIGVVIVLLSLMWAVVSWRRYVAEVPPRSGAGAKTVKGTKHRPRQTWRARVIERMKERWRRRREGNGGMPGRTR
jgi:type VI protein secretion system component VasK